jgi:2-polyprenyl-3-methyl-5-hydroxy-6-metoxy-1,4-benzoquinol methylase
MELVSFCSVCHSDLLLNIDADWNFCRCRACGFVFDSPRPSPDEIVAFYSQAGKYDSWIDEEAARERLWKRRLRKLVPYRTPGTLLDIGTGIGQFLHLAKPFFSEVYGTEISESGVRAAKEKYALDILHGAVEDLHLAPNSFDTITLFHVLEHVPDPGALIGICRELLRGRGTLVIAVPNDVQAWTSSIKKLGKKMGLAPFAKFSPRLGISKAGTSREIHLSHFTPAVLRQLLKTRGCSIVAESLDPYYVAAGVNLFMHAAYYVLHDAILGLFGVNCYDTIWMIARKGEPV